MLAVANRTLELHYGSFMVSESRHDPGEARRRALDVAYGASPIQAQIAGHEGRIYDHGPEGDVNGPDGRMPAVVVWSDGDMLIVVASHDLPLTQLIEIGHSLYV